VRKGRESRRTGLSALRGAVVILRVAVRNVVRFRGEPEFFGAEMLTRACMLLGDRVFHKKTKRNYPDDIRSYPVVIRSIVEERTGERSFAKTIYSLATRRCFHNSAPARGMTGHTTGVFGLSGMMRVPETAGDLISHVGLRRLWE
jgi:hypothetical protein